MQNIYPIHIVIADDHELFRDGFKVMASKFPQVKLIGEAANGLELLALVAQTNPEVVLTDIKMPVMDGIEATKRMAVEYPGIHVIALSMFDEENLIIDMLEAGARGYLLKNAGKEDIIEAIKAVNQDRTYYCKQTSAKLLELIATSKFNPNKKLQKPEFNEREISIIQLICNQKSNKEMADILNLSIRTVEGYREKIQEKMQVQNTAGIVVYAIKNNIYKIK
ncbi:MAG: response regulator transcription factor [Chitinophagaceae bacterium]|nr:response regulator transcription factor [Chitinophagaceae bacterium]